MESTTRTLLIRWMHLEETVPDVKMYVFMDDVHRFVDMETFFSTITLRNWSWFFQPKFVDPDDICCEVLCVFSGSYELLQEPTPTCSRCGASTAFEMDTSKTFGGRYCCKRSSRLLSREIGPVRRCCGSVLPTANTWVDISRTIGVTVLLCENCITIMCNY